MPFGITNNTIITMQNITDTINLTDGYMNFAVNVNNNIFGGLMYFAFLCVIAIILWLGMNKITEEPVPNALAISFACAILGLFMRVGGLLTDRLSWVFPLITLVLGFGLWASKQFG